MKALRKILDTCLSSLAGLSLVVMTVLTTYQVITRYVFNAPSTWSEELVGYMFGWATMFGAAICTGERAHMNIPIVVDMLKEGPKKILLVFGEVVALLFSAIILVYGGFTVSSLAMGQQTSSLGVAVGLFYWVMPICGILMVLYSAMNIVAILKGESEAALDEAAAALAKAEADAKAEKEA
jgi:TRAP-type C4-dicarboxylate transport system permease small subunit